MCWPAADDAIYCLDHYSIFSPLKTTHFRQVLTWFSSRPALVKYLPRLKLSFTGLNWAWALRCATRLSRLLESTFLGAGMALNWIDFFPTSRSIRYVWMCEASFMGIMHGPWYCSILLPLLFLWSHKFSKLGLDLPDSEGTLRGPNSSQPGRANPRNGWINRSVIPVHVI